MQTMLTGSRISESTMFYDVTTERGLTFSVAVADYGMVSVYIKQAGMSRRLPLGKHFSADTVREALVKARDAYKKADVKAALSALLAEFEQLVAA